MLFGFALNFYYTFSVNGSNESKGDFAVDCDAAARWGEWSQAEGKHEGREEESAQTTGIGAQSLSKAQSALILGERAACDL